MSVLDIVWFDRCSYPNRPVDGFMKMNGLVSISIALWLVLTLLFFYKSHLVVVYGDIL